MNKYMKYTKEYLENLRRDPLMKLFAEAFNADLDDIINNVIKESEKESKNNTAKKEQYVAPKTTCQKISENDLKTFVDSYTELENTIKKLEYQFGINFNSTNGTFSIHDSYNNIIWKLVRILLGDENAEQVADFVFGNSNLDTIHDLYEELL